MYYSQINFSFKIYEEVEVLRMALEDECEYEIFVMIRWKGQKIAAPHSQLESI